MFSRHASGTYTNQWMALDMTRFTSGAAPRAGFLTVLEEMPGLVHSEDVTPVLLRDGYWASFNQPYFDDISAASGAPAQCVRDPDSCAATDPRALIFAEKQAAVTSLDDLQLLLGYNRFQSDATGNGDACAGAIACREDLATARRDRYPFGATDGKVSSALLADEEGGPSMTARLGPTSDDQPMFCWSSFDLDAGDKTYSHLGQPDCFDFHWQSFPPP
jgi:hypothetical protein